MGTKMLSGAAAVSKCTGDCNNIDEQKKKKEHSLHLLFLGISSPRTPPEKNHYPSIWHYWSDIIILSELLFVSCLPDLIVIAVW